MEQDTLEVWQLTIPGRVAVTVAGEYGKGRTVTARGEGQRMRLTTKDRRIAEEQILNRDHNPFRNGMMFQVNREELLAEQRAYAEKQQIDFAPHPADAPSDDEMTDETLVQVFDFSVDDGTFAATVEALSELNVRRLQALAITHDAKGSQIAFLNDYVREQYAIGGDTPTYREMQQTPASAV